MKGNNSINPLPYMASGVVWTLCLYPSLFMYHDFHKKHYTTCNMAMVCSKESIVSQPFHVSRFSLKKLHYISIYELNPSNMLISTPTLSSQMYLRNVESQVAIKSILKVKMKTFYQACPHMSTNRLFIQDTQSQQSGNTRKYNKNKKRNQAN